MRNSLNEIPDTDLMVVVSDTDAVKAALHVCEHLPKDQVRSMLDMLGIEEQVVTCRRPQLAM